MPQAMHYEAAYARPHILAALYRTEKNNRITKSEQIMAKSRRKVPVAQVRNALKVGSKNTADSCYSKTLSGSRKKINNKC